jgi:hypothetical protein
MLIVTIFHELTYYLNKLLFRSRTTPLGCSSDGLLKGEAGFLVEGHLIGGTIAVLWGTGEVGKMDKMLGLVLSMTGGNPLISKELSE